MKYRIVYARSPFAHTEPCVNIVEAEDKVDAWVKAWLDGNMRGLHMNDNVDDGTTYPPNRSCPPDRSNNFLTPEEVAEIKARLKVICPDGSDGRWHIREVKIFNQEAARAKAVQEQPG